jgi:fido (protein-threonine AMPylation protein)
MSPRGRPTREALYGQLADQISEVRERLGGLPSPQEAEDIWGDIWLQEAHNSTAIEGNTLMLREVAALLAEGRVVGNKELAEYMEVRGYAQAAQWVYAEGFSGGSARSPITLRHVREVHSVAMRQVWDVSPHPAAGPDEGPGSFRRHNIQAFPGGTRPPDWTDVQPEMSDWIKAAGKLSSDDVAVCEQVAELHARFEQIHPFLDGNGRAGRLVMNLLLLRRGFPPAIIRKRDRTRYLAYLRKADHGDVGPLAELIARAVMDVLLRFVVPAVAGPARLVPLASLADDDLTVRALRAAAERGRLKAQRDDRGQWRSTTAWVARYRKDRHKRIGPPSDVS